jgi:hypothetical protein
MPKQSKSRKTIPPKYERKFDGKTFKDTGGTSTREEAEAQVKGMKAIHKGIKTRIVKAGNYWQQKGIKYRIYTTDVRGMTRSKKEELR